MPSGFSRGVGLVRRPGAAALLVGLAAGALLAVDAAPQASAPPKSAREQRSLEAQPRESPSPERPAPSEASEPRGSEPPRKVLGRIRGTVFDPAKKPLGGLMVTLSAKDESGLLRVTGTNENGQYLFQDLPAGLYDVEVAAEGYAPQTKVKIGCQPPFQNIVDFRLVAEGAPGSKKPETGPPQARPASGLVTAPVRGTLVDARKKPLVECSVTFIALDGKGIYQTFSGSDGAFSLGALPVGRYRALVVSPGHVTLDLKSVEVLQASGLDLSLSLVDYPLNSTARQEDLLPRERPRVLPAPATAPSPGPAATAQPAPTPAVTPAPSSTPAG